MDATLHLPDLHFKIKWFIINYSKDWRLTPSALYPLWESPLAEESWKPLVHQGVCGEESWEPASSANQCGCRKTLPLLFCSGQVWKAVPASELPVNLAEVLWLQHRPKFAFVPFSQGHSLMNLQSVNFHLRVYFLQSQIVRAGLTMAWETDTARGFWIWITHCSVSNEVEFKSPWHQVAIINILHW